ncbi:hemerythrin domain-containing protein [Arsenicicoccus sp. oral taxon 190]|uniref:hemerythrin domain-containing protein n=1 Tax=Arsenicicoccus sp. oral taxon 190 TaxID=1658671 RepID=UPI00067A3C4E|nr:hemerythrin domain-containing protein [Arsenicicoccus sp. oral taxon 190]AKT51351.1 cation-binding protein [Arsenicicoccus sp. oral taxon 190]
MDITEIILDQHDQQRTAFAQLEEWPKKDIEGLTALWQRLQIFLETHAEAEERFFYPHLLDKGTGAADADDGTVEGEVEDAIKDHNKLRDAIRRAGKEKVGSDAWWEAVTDADVANSDHMAEEERQDLRDFRDHAGLQQRHDIAVEFLRWQAQKAADGIKPVNKDAEAYVENPEAELRSAEG